MTDREPDDLYDALRDRLADHGQEPPAQLWAGIRAQLPPPVAPPQLRRRKRRAALLALLLLVVSTGSWQWWRMGQKTGLNGSETTITSSTSPTTASSAPTKQPANSTSAAPASAANSSHPATQATASATLAADATKPDLTANAKTNQHAPATAARPGFSASVGKSAGLKAGPRPEILAAARVAGGSRRRSGHLLAASNEAVSRAGRTQATRLNQPADNGAAKGKNSTATAAQSSDTVAVLAGRRHHFSHRKTAIAPSTSTAGLTTAAGAARYSLARQGASRRHQPEGAPAAATPDAVARAAQSPKASVAPETATPGAISFAEWSRPVALRQLPWATPLVQAVADTAPHLPAADARWSLQVLAGPAVTYRLLGSTLLAGRSAAANLAFYDQSGASTSIPAQEQAAIGYGAQVQVRRALSGRWAVSTGLGYYEYATSLNLKTVALPAGSSPIFTNVGTILHDSGQVRTVHLRDTYRFLTVPVRFSYQLGAGGRHLRLGLLAGADMAWYLGGATTEGSACGCETHAWGLSGSPYRPLSLALNLGVDLRYRLAPRWELLAQPSATFFLTSLARPNTGFEPRYLLGGSTLLGVSYGLH
ncbi:hypothetical protein [Hymenobacter terricola]|uniref:hypothetical protein n=1 Tax=Hymenobacter terricola TaxID=2819236 RepID=UPI001B311565|nr:hypothetical protein [Hymenobacter terricola]